MRQWLMLRLIPRQPFKISTTELMHALADEGFTITPRTLQRDLIRFSAIYPLVCDDRDKPFGWSWMTDGGVMDLPGMDSHTALAFYLADKHLEPILPRETVDHLRPHFEQARHVLDTIHADSGAPAWRDKVRVLRRGRFLAPPPIRSEVQGQVYDALLLNRKLRLVYQSRQKAEKKEYEVNPLGIVLKDAVIYLICTCWDYTDIRLMTLHRMTIAEKLDTPAVCPVGFSLDAYIASGGLDFTEAGKIRLKARISDDIAYHLRERPLHPEQSITPAEDRESMILETPVNDSGELRWWLLGFGDQVEVLAPESLRREFKGIAKRMAAAYTRS